MRHTQLLQRKNHGDYCAASMLKRQSLTPYRNDSLTPPPSSSIVSYNFQYGDSMALLLKNLACLRLKVSFHFIQFI